MAGDNATKLKMLHMLSSADFNIAENHKIPDNFIFDSENGKLRGAILGSLINNHPEVFEKVYTEIENKTPHQIRCVGGEYKTYKLSVPEDPLCVITCVVEGSGGSLIPLVANNSLV